jgi:hypothetical protein
LLFLFLFFSFPSYNGNPLSLLNDETKVARGSTFMKIPARVYEVNFKVGGEYAGMGGGRGCRFIKLLYKINAKFLNLALQNRDGGRVGAGPLHRRRTVADHSKTRAGRN